MQLPVLELGGKVPPNGAGISLDFDELPPGMREIRPCNVCLLILLCIQNCLTGHSSTTVALPQP